MCYDVSLGLSALIKYAKHRQDDPNKIAELQKELALWRIEEHQHFHSSGYNHPSLLVFTNEEPETPHFYAWGLIPSWCKDAKSAILFSNQSLNARGETIFEKPMFKSSARNRRCIIYVDGFFEYHHYKQKTYPFYITHKEDQPLILAGLWDEWVNRETGDIIRSISIVTTYANKLMAKIHNNPKLAAPRMPVILHREDQEKWLMKIENTEDENKIKQLLLPFPAEELKYITVGKLKGKEATGNTPEAILSKIYPELVFE